MKKFVLLIAVLAYCVQAAAQVSISVDTSGPDPSAMLDVQSTNKGLLPPRMTLVQRDGILSPAWGLQIFATDCNDMQFYNGFGWIPMSNTGLLTTPGSINGNSTPCINAAGVGYSVPPVPKATGYH